MDENGGKELLRTLLPFELQCCSLRNTILGAFPPEEDSKDDKTVNYPDGTMVSPFSLMAPSPVALGSFMNIDAVGRTSRRGSNISASNVKQDVDAVRRGQPASMDMTDLRSLK
ncbi:hypothetical protein RvY_01459 [Ramazzottius varieornatus]|uniref:Uncharacterized protein n=1 Tax=Ramazzottius varieornatus TaxID=947166 RepID=A0A1D1UGE1_RAMVA|nr:hypothetical protein RvY_01459 [Ramazzottius varieornatus]